MKKILIYLLLIAIIGSGALQLTTIATTQQSAPTNSIYEAEEIYIPIIIKGIESGFWRPVEVGAHQAARDYGVKVTFEGTRRGETVQEQLDILEEALANSPQVIVLSALDSRAVTPYIESAQAIGIPIIGIDSGVDSPIVRTTVATDNYAAGALAADKMAEFIEEEGEIGIASLSPESRVGADRTDGFVDTIIQNYPNIEIIPIAYSEGGIKELTEIAKKMLIDYPDIKGIFGGSGIITEGIVSAIKTLNKEGQVVVVGFDSGRRVIEAIREGIVVGAVTQNPLELGYQAVETAVRVYRGERVPEFIDTGFAWYDNSNIDNPEIQRLLYD